jgi:hypothetical protein
MTLHLTFKPRTIGLLLAVITICLALQSIFGEYVIQKVIKDESNSVAAQVFDLFSVNAEETIPTWYSVTLLLCAAGLLTVIAVAKHRTKAPYRLHWTILAIGFLYLAMDEGAVIHEILADPLQKLFSTTGFLFFGWQIVAIPLVIFLGIFFLRFWLHLPRQTKVLFAIAGVLYVSGAVFLDAVGANEVFVDKGVTLPYLVMGTLEELCEMLGVVVFIYALLSYIKDMQYTYVVQPHEAVSPTDDHGVVNQSTLSWKRLIAVVAIVIVAIDIGLVWWATHEVILPEMQSAQEPTPIYQTLVDHFQADNMLVTRMTDISKVNDTTLQQYAKSLLNLYSEVTVIVFPTAHNSIVIAGTTLPFDSNSLSQFLRDNGETQFIVLDTPALKSLTASTAP